MGRVVQASLAAVSLLKPARLSVRLRLVSVLRSTRGTLLDMDMKQDGPRQEVAAGKQMGTERLECCGERCSPSGYLAGCSVAYFFGCGLRDVSML